MSRDRVLSGRPAISGCRGARTLPALRAVAVVVALVLAGCAGTPEELPPEELPLVTDAPGVDPITSDDPLQFTFDRRGLTGDVVAVEVAAFVAEDRADGARERDDQAGTDQGGNDQGGTDQPRTDSESPAARRWELTPEGQSPLRITLPLDGLEDGVAYELEFALVNAAGLRAVVANRVPLTLRLGLPRPVPGERELITLSRRQPLSWRFPEAAGKNGSPTDEGARADGEPDLPAAGASAVVRISGGLQDGSEEPVANAAGPWEPSDPLVDAGAFTRRDAVAWQVRVVSRQGVLGPWSPEGQLHFDSARAVPRPRAHTGGGEAVVATPGLSWEAPAGAVAYRVEVGAGDSAQRIVRETEVPRLRLDPGELERLLDGAATRTVRWRVAAIGPDGVETPASDLFAFRYVPFMGGLETVVPVNSQVTVVMGSADAEQSDERPAVPVALQLPFEMTRYPVTNRVVAALVALEVSAGRMEVVDGVVRTTAEAPRTLIGLEALDFGAQVGLQVESAGSEESAESDDSAESEERLVVRDGYASHPAVGLSWYGAVAVANALSLLEAREPVYAGVHSAEEEIAMHPERDGYRLPSEAEWAAAVAARQRIVAGAELTVIEERELSSIDLRGINYLRSGDRWEDPRPPYTRNGGPTSPVGSVGAGSPLGISDLLGNVWEWTADWYDPEWYRRIGEGQVESPWQGPDEPVPDVYGRLLRTVRGTAWNTPQDDVRPGNRGGFAPGATSHSIGVRLVRSLQ